MYKAWLWLAAIVSGLAILWLVARALSIPAAYVFAPLLSIAILAFGFGSLRSLQAGAAHIPDGDPEVVDPAIERVTYWCAGCGAEVLLLVRGTESPPRHCGERMHERVELSREPHTNGR